ncbi:hypothetical protein Tco_1431993 [Tanacetum coccineum]
MISSCISISLAIRNLARSASYSASLSVVSNSNLSAYVHSFPSGLTTIRPTPEPSELEAPSVNSVGIKRLLDDLRVTAAKVCVTTAKQKLVLFINFNEKYANEFLPLNSISCSPNSIAHLAMRPDFSGFARICFMGLSLRTCISTTLMIPFEVARYIVRVSPFVGITIVGNDSRHSFIL